MGSGWNNPVIPATSVLKAANGGINIQAINTGTSADGTLTFAGTAISAKNDISLKAQLTDGTRKAIELTNEFNNPRINSTTGNLLLQSNKGIIRLASLTTGAITGKNIIIDNTGSSLVRDASGNYTKGVGSYTGTSISVDKNAALIIEGSGTGIQAAGTLDIIGAANGLGVGGVRLGTTGLSGTRVSIQGENLGKGDGTTHAFYNTGSVTSTSSDVYIKGISQKDNGLNLQGNITAQADVNLIGQSGDASTTSSGYGLNLSKQVKATTGNIAVTATSTSTSTSQPAANLASGASLVTSSGKTITVNADTLQIDTSATPASINAGSSGLINIRPVTGGVGIDLGGSDVMTTGSNVMGLSNPELGRITAGQLNIGNSSAGNINVSSAVTTPDAAGNLALITGGNLAINSSLQTGATGTKNLTLNLTGSGSATETGSIKTNHLELLGSNASYTLNNTANDATTLAANAKTVSYTDANALSIGSVNSTTGITASGTVSVATQSGNLSVTQAVSTVDTSDSAIVLNAGQASAAGTASGGDIQLSGSYSFSTGTGGRTTFYTGNTSNANLTSLVGSGSGRFRYNSDESTANYTAALGSGLYAIYREAPIYTIALNSVTKTYDGQIFSGGGGYVTSGTLLNGDSSAGITGTYGGTAQGVRNVGSYSITGSGLYSTLGYSLSTTGSTLTVNKADLTVTATQVTKTYDGTLSASGSGTVGTLAGAGAGETVDSAGVQSFIDKNYGVGNKTVQASGVTIRDATGQDVTANYNVTYVANTTSTINKANLTLAGTRTYDGGTTFAGQYLTATGVNGETFAVTGAGDTSNLTSKHVTDNQGSALHSVTGLALGTSNNGGLSDNYNALSTTGSSVTLTKANATVTGTATNVTYNGNTQNQSAATTSGFIAGDAITISGEASGKNAGTYTSALQVTGNDAGNYIVTVTNADLNIAKAALTLTGNSLATTYNGQTQSVSGYTASGLQGSDTVADLTNVSASGASGRNAGSYTNAVTAGTQTNYDVTVQNGTLAIAKANATVTGTATNVTYNGGTQTQSAATSSGFIAGDAITISGEASGKNAGTYTSALQVTGNDAGNYNVTVTNADLNIAKAALTLTGNSLATTYNGQTQSVSGYTASGLQGSDTVADLTNVSASGASGRNAGSYTNAVTAGTQTNYDVTVQDGTLAIAKANATVTGAATNVTYNGGTQTQSAATSSGFIAGDAITIGGEASGKNAGTYTSALQVTGNDAGNYNVTITNADLSIAKANLTLTAVTDSKTYDATTTSSQNVTISGLQGSDTVTGLSQSFDSKNAGSRTLGVDAGYTVNDGNSGGNYTVSTRNATGTIARKDVTLSAMTAANKTYDGNDSAAITSGTVLGTVAGETLSVSGSGTFDTKNAGNGKTVTVNDVALLSKDNGSGDWANYQLTTMVALTTTATISPRTLSASLVGSINKTYDSTSNATLSAGNFSLSGFVTGEGASVSQTIGTYASANVDANGGNGAVSAHLLPGQFSASAGTLLSNYVLPVSASGNVGTITPAALTIKVNNTTAFVTQDANAATNNGYSYTGLQGLDSEATALVRVPVANDRTYSGTTYPVAGTYSGVYGLGYTPTAQHGNYSVTVEKGHLTVIPADQLLIHVASQTETYGNRNAFNAGKAGSVTAQYCLAAGNCSGANLYTLNMLSNDGIHWTATDNTGNTVQFDTSVAVAGHLSQGGYLNAGNYAWGVANLTSSNPGQFNGNTVDSSTLAINRLAMTPTADAINKVYDGTAWITNAPLKAPQALAGDAVSALASSGSYSTKNVISNDSVTLGNLSLLGADKDNYALTVSSLQATGSITPKAISVSGITASNKVYDGGNLASVSTAAASFNGMVNGDDLSVSATGRFADKNAGVGKQVLLSSVYGGNDLDNYTITDQASTTATISKAALTVSGNSGTAVYNGQTQSVSGYTLSGLVGGDTAADLVGIQASGASGRNAGTYTNTVSADAQTNYDITLQNGLLQIGKANASVAGSLTNVTYNGQTQIQNAPTLSGFVQGDDITVIGQATGKNAGTYVSNLTVNGNDASNYDIRITDANLIVAKKDVSLTAIAAANKTYDGTRNASITGATVSGTVQGESLSATGAGLFDTKHAGTGKTVTVADVTQLSLIDGSGSWANYNLSSAGSLSTSADIAKAPLTVTATQISKTYDGTTSASGSGTVSALAGAGELISSAGSQAFLDKNAGTHKIVRASGVTIRDSASQDVTSNYEISYVDNTSSTILQATLQASLQGSVEKIYDGNTNARLNNTNYAITGWAPGEGSYVTQTAGSYADQNVSTNPGTGIVSTTLMGSHFTAWAGTHLSNYVLPTTVSGQVGKITPAPLTIKVNDTTAFVTQNASNAADMGYSYNGFVGTENASTALSFTPNASHRTYVGSNHFPAVGQYSNVYDLSSVPSALNGNYAITVQQGSLNVIPVDKLLITIRSQSDLYGNRTAANAGQANTVTAQYCVVQGGVCNSIYSLNMTQGDGTRWSGVDNTGGTVQFDTAVNTNGHLSQGGYLNAGNYSYGIANLFTQAPNQQFGDSVVNAGILSIGRLAITPSASGASKVYDGTASAAGAALIIPALRGDQVQALAGSGSYSTRNVIANDTVTYTNLSLQGADRNNYSLTTTTVQGQGSITPRALTLSATSDTKTYDGTKASTGPVSVTGLAAGDTLSGLSQSYASKNALGTDASTLLVDATYVINDGNAGGNYQVITQNASGTIRKASASVSAIPATTTYNGQMQEQQAPDSSGFLTGDDIAITGKASGKNPGTYASNLKVSGSDATNYDIAVTNADLVIRSLPAPMPMAPSSAAQQSANPITRVGLVGFGLAGAAVATADRSAQPIRLGQTLLSQACSGDETSESCTCQDTPLSDVEICFVSGHPPHDQKN